MVSCPLCTQKKTKLQETINTIPYWYCKNCKSFFKHPNFIASFEEEKQRYLLHQNDVNDTDYQKFVAPFVEAITAHFSTDTVGLDFGAGTGPVITQLLKKENYKTILYDPFFHPNKEALNKKYDYIICCEVIEHFRNPNKEFTRLKQLLKPKGKLFCMTHLLPDLEKVRSWYYLRDFTHIFFYSEQTMQWIQEHFKFSDVTVKDRLIVFST